LGVIEKVRGDPLLSHVEHLFEDRFGLAELFNFVVLGLGRPDERDEKQKEETRGEKAGQKDGHERTGGSEGQ
jgi:hypothetical protein